MSYLADGNHDALAVIFDRYQRLITRVTLQILRDPAEAEDVTQSVFIAVLETAKKFRAERGTVRVWLLQHAYHLALNRRRYLSLRGSYHTKTDTESLSDNGLYGVAPASDAKRVIQQALAQLNSKQRETLELAFYDGMTMQEIAERTGQSYVNIRHHYYRGLEKLRVILGYAGTNRRPNANAEEAAYART
jgi:RNA polymerase sigma-70 factor (ECF subfamily)